MILQRVPGGLMVVRQPEHGHQTGLFAAAWGNEDVPPVADRVGRRPSSPAAASARPTSRSIPTRSPTPARSSRWSTRSCPTGSTRARPTSSRRCATPGSRRSSARRRRGKRGYCSLSLTRVTLAPQSSVIPRAPRSLPVRSLSSSTPRTLLRQAFDQRRRPLRDRFHGLEATVFRSWGRGWLDAVAHGVEEVVGDVCR